VDSWAGKQRGSSGGQSSGGSGGSGSSGKAPTRPSTMLVLAGPADDVRAAKCLADEIESSLGDAEREMVIDTYEVRFGNLYDMRKAVMSYVPA